MVKGRNSQAICDLLDARHRDDTIIFECKTGQTTTGVLRMDAWVLRSSWSNPSTLAYEIKVSRNDFVRDTKWPGYLDYCNEFYFACPHGLIQPEELPEHAGLIWLSKTGNRLTTRRKAPFRAVDIPDPLWRYIVMARAQISPIERRSQNSIEYWQQWLKEKAERRSLGMEVSRAIREHIERTNRRSNHLETRIATYRDIEERLKELGFDPTKSVREWDVRDRLAELKGELPRNMISTLKAAEQNLSKVLQLLGNGEVR